MEVLPKDDGKKGKFYIEINKRELAQMTYVWAGTDRIIIDHTAVDDSLKSKNAGKQMVVKAVEFVRKKTYISFHCAHLPKVCLIK